MTERENIRKAIRFDHPEYALLRCACGKKLSSDGYRQTISIAVQSGLTFLTFS